MNPSKDTRDHTPGSSKRHGPGRVLTVVATVAAAAVLNLVVYGLGRAAGGDFRFTASGVPAEVDAITVTGFTVLPLLAGMTLVAALVRIWPWVVNAALAVAPALALGTILIMTIPADFDTTSKITLASCHVALVPVTVAGLLTLRRRRDERTASHPPAVETGLPASAGHDAG
ncbi:DUF6069 family protein [Planobispora siamensis]|uniref:Uncharacterized protein n=1 Tax=Planobispora siamensis TaxID=936338 RepID=A0A8J3SQJ4_9ACTN|nr:DUF6069 family protein [Planobispora siamensis]GIH96564.1 hypothetical protein Psi01_71940 [Planobispora siamensis]